MKLRTLATVLLSLFAATHSDYLQAQDAPPKAQRQTERSLPQINAIDKLLAIEASLNSQKKRTSEEQWSGDYEALYKLFMRDGSLSAIPGEGNNEIANAFNLGIKASDAVLALKARSIEPLNHAAEQIEQLAIKLGASSKELGMAETVKRYANDGKWLNAFVALGFLERNVIRYLRENGDKRSQAVLVIVGGWLQAGRCVTYYIRENYTDDVSNILREPRLLALMEEEMAALPPAYQNDEFVKKVMAFLPEAKRRVNVGMRDPVKKEDVEWLHQQFDALVTEIAPNPKPAGR